MTTLAEDMARWIWDLRYEALPVEVVTRTKLFRIAERSPENGPPLEDSRPERAT